MTVLRVPFSLSDELAKEMSFFSETSDGEKLFAKFKTPDDLLRHIETSFEYLDLTRVPGLFGPARVLDVGVGFGLTSAYLALKGMEVTAVEPSLKQCEDMVKNFQRLGVRARVANATGEVIDRVPGPFDVVVFYSSLHHCDDVPKALANAHGLLRPGGKIFLFEPVLKFYRTKAWFHKEMLEHPENVGHYGGNEHIYRHGEYIAYLKGAGFRRCRSIPSLTYGRVPKRAPWDSAARYAVKKAYFWMMRNLLMRIPFAPALLNRLSLINPVIIAERI